MPAFDYTASTEQVASGRDSLQQRANEWSAIVRNFVARYVQTLMAARILDDTLLNGGEEDGPTIPNRWFNLVFAERPAVKAWARQLHSSLLLSPQSSVVIRTYIELDNGHHWHVQDAQTQRWEPTTHRLIEMERWSLTLQGLAGPPASLSMTDIERLYQRLAVLIRAVHTSIQAVPTHSAIPSRHSGIAQSGDAQWRIRIQSGAEDPAIIEECTSLSESLVGTGEPSAHLTLPTSMRMDGGDKVAVEVSVEYRRNCRLSPTGSPLHTVKAEECPKIMGMSDEFVDVPAPSMSEPQKPSTTLVVERSKRPMVSMAHHSKDVLTAPPTPAQINAIVNATTASSKQSLSRTPSSLSGRSGPATVSSSLVPTSSSSTDLTHFVKRLEWLCMQRQHRASTDNEVDDDINDEGVIPRLREWLAANGVDVGEAVMAAQASRTSPIVEETMDADIFPLEE